MTEIGSSVNRETIYGTDRKCVVNARTKAAEKCET